MDVIYSDKPVKGLNDDHVVEAESRLAYSLPARDILTTCVWRSAAYAMTSFLGQKSWREGFVLDLTYFVQQN